MSVDPARPGAPESSRTRSGSSASRRRRPPRRHRRARRVHRVIHRVDVWSLAKIGAVYMLCAYVVALVSGVLLWQGAESIGTIEGIEGFMEDTGGYDTYVVDGTVVLQSAFFIGLVLAVLGICLIILAGILFNLTSDLVGGIRLTMIDEDLLVVPPTGERDARRGERAASERADVDGPPRPAPPESRRDTPATVSTPSTSATPSTSSPASVASASSAHTNGWDDGSDADLGEPATRDTGRHLAADPGWPVDDPEPAAESDEETSSSDTASSETGADVRRPSLDWQ